MTWLRWWRDDWRAAIAQAKKARIFTRDMAKQKPAPEAEPMPEAPPLKPDHVPTSLPAAPAPALAPAPQSALRVIDDSPPPHEQNIVIPFPVRRT
jgi:hypothetical protein